MQTLLQDLRFTVRQLRKSAGFTLTAILSLALGIGATTAVFSVVYAILMIPYPYAAPDRMVHMRLSDQSSQEMGFGLSGAQWQQIRKSPVIEDAFAADDWNLTVTGHDLPEDLNGVYMTANSFAFMGVPPALGRGLMPSDAIDGQDPQPVAVLGYKFWRRHFNSDPSVIGQTLQLVRKNYTIVGVAAQRFTWEDGDGYLPLKITQDPTKAYYVGLRLKPGITHAVANAALQPLIDQFAKETPKHFPTTHFQLRVVGLNERFVHELGGTLYLLLLAVGLLLAIGCGNVSILLLARGTARQHEFAIRTAVGASGVRLVRQLLTESLMLALVGAGLGVLLAYRSLGWIVASLPEYSYPHEANFHVNLPVLLFSVGLALLTGIVFGLFPALQLARPEIGQIMQSSTRKVAGSVRGKRLHSTLIAGQIALTLLLLTAAGVAIEGFVHMMHVDLGYNPHNIMSVGIPVHQNTFPTWADRSNYFTQLRDKIATLPDVLSTGISTNATPPDSGWEQPVELKGKTASDEQKASINFVDSHYFSTLQIPLRKGRLWDETELQHGALMAVVNETFVKRYYANSDVLAGSVKVPSIKSTSQETLVAPGSDGWLQVIGVTADTLDDGLDKPVKPAIYLPYTVNMWMWSQILVRTRVDPRNVTHSVKQQIVSVNPDQQATMWDDGVLETWIKNQQVVARGRLVSVLFAAFSVLALILAAIG